MKKKRMCYHVEKLTPLPNKAFLKHYVADMDYFSRS